MVLGGATSYGTAKALDQDIRERSSRSEAVCQEVLGAVRDSRASVLDAVDAAHKGIRGLFPGQELQDRAAYFSVPYNLKKDQ